MATKKSTTTRTKTDAKKASSKKTTSRKPATKTVAAKSTKKTTSTKAAAAKANKTSTTKKSTGDKFTKLKQWNLALGVLHAAQAVAVALLASDYSVPVRAGFLTFNEATQSLESASRHLFDLPLAWLIVAFFAMSAIAHFAIAGPWFKGYKKDLEKGMNRARWFEYSLSASTMIVAIAALVGVVNLSMFIALFALTAVMNLTGLIMEVHNQTTQKTNWLSFWVGTLAGVIPWVVIAWYFITSWLYGSGNPPTFVYAIFVSIFIAFNTFAINMWLQYKKKGKWADYLYGEKMYMILSLVAKSALAWQVFGGTLRP